jgi:NADH kinase
VLNEVTLHRGRYPHLTVVDAFFDGQLLTEAVVSPHSYRIKFPLI